MKTLQYGQHELGWKLFLQFKSRSRLPSWESMSYAQAKEDRVRRPLEKNESYRFASAFTPGRS
jgi:hypothetical protein